MGRNLFQPCNVYVEGTHVACLSTYMHVHVISTYMHVHVMCQHACTCDVMCMSTCIVICLRADIMELAVEVSGSLYKSILVSTLSVILQ